MMNILLVIYVMLAAIFIPRCAVDNSSNTTAPSIERKIKCDPVEGKKPWCACKSSLSNEIVDLTSLGAKDGDINTSIKQPVFISNAVDGWQVAWSPCEDFYITANQTLNPDTGEESCKGIGLARFTKITAEKTYCYGYGPHDTSATFYSNGYNPHTGKEHYYIKFYFIPENKIPRNAIIWLQCTDDDESYIKYQGDKQGKEVVMFYSKCACENKCGKSPRPDPPDSQDGGMIAGISIAGLAVVAFLMVLGWKKYNTPPFAVQVEAQENDERGNLLHVH